MYALELQKEHEKARHFYSLSPEEKQEIHREAELVEQGCQRLGALLQRLGLERFYSAMRAKEVTLSRAKGFHARDFLHFGMSDDEATRLWDTLQYATAVRQSYLDVMPPDSYDEARGFATTMASPSAASASARSQQQTRTRRLSALGRELLTQFDGLASPGPANPGQERYALDQTLAQMGR